MRALYFAFSLFFSLLGLGGYLAIDYFLLNQSARSRGEEPISFVTYMGGWTGLAATFAEGDSAARDLPETLVAMMPRAPEGWATAPTRLEDATPFVTPGLSPEDLALITDAATENEGRGVDQVRTTYTSGPRTVIVELVRYPNLIFTSFAATHLKMELQFRTMEIPTRDFAVVRGLPVLEARLAADAPARVFLADIGGQIHLRVTAPATFADADLLPFLETLHVPAMNADVIDKVPGLGEVPLIVLASGLAPEDHALWQAEREAEATRIAAEREAAKEAERQKKTAQAEAEAEAAPSAGGNGSTFSSLFGGLMGGGEGSGGGGLSAAARTDVQTALIDAARSGNGVEAAAMAGLLYGAIADELGKTEMKGAPGTGGGGGFSFPSASSSGRKSEIKVGIGSCSSEGGGKFCSVGGSD